MFKPVQELHRGAEVAWIVNMAAIAVVDTQETEQRAKQEADLATTRANDEFRNTSRALRKFQVAKKSQTYRSISGLDLRPREGSF